MMTQADVLSESMKNGQDQLSPSSAAYVNSAGPQDELAENQPDLVANSVGYKYDQNSINEEVILGGVNNKSSVAKTENTPIQPSKYFADSSAVNSSKGLRNIIIGGMVFSGVITIALIIQIAIGTTQVPYRIGIVTQEKTCSDIGADMVHKGGKSVDAFIASSLCLSVVNPFSAGPGAGGFLLIRDHKHDKNIAMNCYFKSGEHLKLDYYKENPKTGKDSVSLPGEFKCLEAIYKYAKFNWKKLTKPAINLANNGFLVSKILADHLKKLDFEKDILSDPIMSEIFLKDGKLVKENDRIKNPRMAKTLKMLNGNNNAAYEIYGGDLSNSIINQLGSESQLKNDDFKKYQVDYSNTDAMTSYNDFILMTAPFPSNGPILKYVIELMKTSNLKVDDFKTTRFYKNLLQATRLGYQMSSYAADPRVEVSSTFYPKVLKESIDYFKLITSGNSSTAKHPLLSYKLDNYKIPDTFVTNFVSVNDHNDLMISYTGTLGNSWGSRVMTSGGFIMNNGMSLFTYGSSNSNQMNGVDKNKQPRALFTPILAYNHKNPCVRRFSISYSHQGMETDDYALTELSDVILKLFTDYSLYENAISDKRIQYHFETKSCFEDGFSSKVKDEIIDGKVFSEKKNCSYHGIDLVMKKDHILYCKIDTNRSMDHSVLFNS